ncbi:MAG: glycosyltransferase [Lachnospiraceae bacterium]|nr:glycosyltransferase [Lachnospiraceae bacterium]
MILNWGLEIMEKLKVIHVVNTGKYSGAEKVAISTIEGMRDHVNSVYVCLDGPVVEILKSKKIDYVCITKLKVHEISAVIKKIKPDIIHAHDYTAGIMCALTMTKTPIINHVHNNAPWIKKFNIKSVSYVLSSFRYERIIAVSKAIIEENLFSTILSKKAIIIRNPFNSTIIKELAKKDNKGDANSYDIVYLGRLSEAKNPIAFVNIVEQVAKVIADTKVGIIGDGELREKVIDIINCSGMNNKIELLGHKDNPYPILEMAKVLCVPSKWEGYGIAATEALAFGVPVVARCVGGLVDIVNEDCGFLCKSDEEIANKIIAVLRDSKLHNKLSKGAKRRAEEIEKSSDYIEQMNNEYIKIKRKIKMEK